MRVFSDTAHGDEHIALVKGDITTTGRAGAWSACTRMDPMLDVVGPWPEAGGGMSLATRCRLIAAEGRGALVLLRDTTMKLTSEATALRRKRCGNTGWGRKFCRRLGISRIMILLDEFAQTQGGGAGCLWA